MKKFGMTIVAAAVTLFPFTALADGPWTISTNGTTTMTGDSSAKTATDTTGDNSSTSSDDGGSTSGTMPGDGSNHGTKEDGSRSSESHSSDSMHSGLANALSHVKNPKAIAVLQSLLNGGSPVDALQQLLGSSTGGTGASDTSSGDASGTSTGNSTTDGDSTSASSASSSSSNSTDLTTATEQLLQALEVDKQDGKDALKAAFAKIKSELSDSGDTLHGIRAGEDEVSVDPTDLVAFHSLGQLYKKAGDASVKAFVDGKQPMFDVKPFIKDGRTLVPLRGVSEALGAVVNWDSTTQTITLTRNGHTVTLTIGSSTATVDGQTVKLDVPAFIQDGARTVVPVRFITEAFGALVNWIPTGNIVDITTTGTTGTTGNSASVPSGSSDSSTTSGSTTSSSGS